MKSSSERVPDLETAFRTSRPALIRHAGSLGAGADAEDLVQEVWFKIQGISEPIANPHSYLMRVTYTVVIDRLRAKKRAQAREEAWSDASDADRPVDSVERSYIARETIARVAEKLEAIGEPAAMIFRRHRFDGQTQRLIAEELGMGLSTVEKHLRRVYKELFDLEDEA